MNIYPIAMLQTTGGHILLVHKQHVAAAKDATVAVIHRVDGGVVLVMTAASRAHHVLTSTTTFSCTL